MTKKGYFFETPRGESYVCGIVGDPLDIDSIFRLDYGATPYGEETLTPAYSPYDVAFTVPGLCPRTAAMG